MSRPFRPLVLAAVTLALAGCKTSTPYTAMYSPRKSYYVPPPEKKDKAVEALLGSADTGQPGDATTTLPGGLPPAGITPGLPAAGLPVPPPPAPDPLAPTPTPGAPAF